MLLSVVCWDDSIRSAAESKLRTSIYMAGGVTADAPQGKVYSMPSTAYGRAVETVRWVLDRQDMIKDPRFIFTTLMPAYALADAAETCSEDGEPNGDPRLIMLQSLWDQCKTIDIGVVVSRGPQDDTLVDAVKDMSKRHFLVCASDVWNTTFGDALARAITRGQNLAYMRDTRLVQTGREDKATPPPLPRSSCTGRKKRAKR